MPTLWEYRYAQRMQQMKSSAIRELLKVSELPDIISFGGGLPAAEVFPYNQVKEACIKVLDEQGKQALQYGTTEGYRPLRELIARHTARIGINVTADNVIITAGSQQALDILGKVFINRGDRILVENPTYLGALQAWRAYGADYVVVPMDDDGIITDRFEDAFCAGPKFIYIQPNFHNPCGVTLSNERRKILVEMASNKGIPIIEDDPYGQLRYEGEYLAPIVNIDSQRQGNHDPYSGNVIYLSTFSKILSPGLRLGSIIAPVDVIPKFVTAKQGMDLHTATFNQMIAYEVAKGGFIDQHVKVICKVYSERRDAMLDSLEEHMPDGVEWTHPKGGLFLWVKMPEKINATELFNEAVKHKVAFVPGEHFFASGGGYNTMRLNFSYCSPEQINEGISRLAVSIKEFMKH